MNDDEKKWEQIRQQRQQEDDRAWAEYSKRALREDQIKHRIADKNSQNMDGGGGSGGWLGDIFRSIFGG